LWHNITETSGTISPKYQVLANGFQKKTKKTPKTEIEKALKIKREYETEQ